MFSSTQLLSTACPLLFQNEKNFGLLPFLLFPHCYCNGVKTFTLNRRETNAAGNDLFISYLLKSGPKSCHSFKRYFMYPRSFIKTCQAPYFCMLSFFFTFADQLMVFPDVINFINVADKSVGLSAQFAPCVNKELDISLSLLLLHMWVVLIGYDGKLCYLSRHQF